MTSTGESKLWFYLNNQRSVYAKVLPQSLTLAYDHGVQQNNGRSFNWFGGVDTNRALNNNVWKVGVEVFETAGRWSVNNLVQYSQSDKNLLWLHKAYLTHNNWFFNRYHTADLSKKSCSSSAILVAYRQKGEENNDLSARFEFGSWSNLEEFKQSHWQSNKVTLNWVRSQKGKWAHGLEVNFLVILVIKPIEPIDPQPQRPLEKNHKRLRSPTPRTKRHFEVETQRKLVCRLVPQAQARKLRILHLGSRTQRNRIKEQRQIRSPSRPQLVISELLLSFFNS